ncbi:MAG: hypothetical protein R3F21_26065 [Myxococcota bacterium]
MGISQRWLGTAGMLAATSLSCTSMSIYEKVVLSEPVAPRSDRECDVRFFAPTAPVLKQCVVSNELVLQDTGFTLTSRCDTWSVRAAIRRIACEYGANVASTKRLTTPMSTCAETEATLYRCDEAILPPRPGLARAAAAPADEPGEGR